MRNAPARHGGPGRRGPWVVYDQQHPPSQPPPSRDPPQIGSFLMSSRSSLLLPVLLALAGCGSSDQEESADPAAAAQSTEAGTEQKASQFPGYPVLVELSSLDSRVASSLEGQTAEGKAVALAPGLYTAYNTQFRDLDRYYQDPVLYGDQMMMQEHFPMSPGTFWGGVQPGSQEPKG